MTARPVPVPTPQTQPCWDGCAAGELRLQQRAACVGAWFCPRPEVSATRQTPPLMTVAL